MIGLPAALRGMEPHLRKSAETFSVRQ
jgi:hypothetical protein